MAEGTYWFKIGISIKEKRPKIEKKIGGTQNQWNNLLVLF